MNSVALAIQHLCIRNAKFLVAEESQMRIQHRYGSKTCQSLAKSASCSCENEIPVWHVRVFTGDSARVWRCARVIARVSEHGLVFIFYIYPVYLFVKHL